MKRVILTSSSGVGLIPANPADMVAPLIFRFVAGPLPTSHHLDQYLGGRMYPRDPEVHWSDLVKRSSQTGLAHKNLGLIWFCKAYGVDLIELWFDPDQWELGPVLEGLASGPMPAISGLDPKLATLARHDERGRNAAYRRSRLSLTEFGKAVLEGREDFRRHNPIRRWWGGTLLTSERLWRWDRERRLLVAP